MTESMTKSIFVRLDFDVVRLIVKPDQLRVVNL